MRIYSPIRPHVRPMANSAILQLPSLLDDATTYLGGISPYHYWDFVNDRALFASVDRGQVSNTPNWSYTRADSQSAYAQTSAGVLVPFATGELRRTARGVLIEGTATNLCLQSQTFDNASWTKGNASVTANAVVAPDGTSTADFLVETSATGSHRVFQTITKAASAIAYTFSLYAKAGTRRYLRISVADSTETDSAYANFDLQAGSALTTSGSGFTAISSSIEALANGWYRCMLMATSDTETTLGMHVRMTTDGSTSSYTGDGASGIYIWGAQLEAASFASSYIPTTSASATRANDVLTVSSPGVDYPMTVWAEIYRGTDTGASESYFQTYFDANNRVIITIAATDIANVTTRAGGVTQATPNTTATPSGATYKIAGRINTNSFNTAINGTLGTLDTSGSLPTTPTEIHFGANNGANFAQNYIRRAAIFNSALTDTQLQTITT